MGCCSAKVVNYELPDNVEVLQRTEENVKECSDLLTRAFAGSATSEPSFEFDWCLGDDEKIKGQYDNPKRFESLNWIFKFIVEFVFAKGGNGAVLACRGDDGKIVGVSCVRVERGASCFDCTEITAGTRAGSMTADQEWYTLKSHRMKALEAVLKSLHEKHASDPHVYVWAVAVDTKAQGQGIGGKLMRAAAAIADYENIPSYLETSGPKNTAIYQKYGYAVVEERKVITIPTKDAPDAEEAPHPEVAMVRPANYKKEEPNEAVSPPSV